ncbi:hypothetical protein CERZMDRAFT_80217 [Cercospora zeae-maydis SCOH1-5]|uniref:BTB domain-containing protein n=1 Tax=Cercospora zeae-maydis SCOH1-5 TaxID=717836 RepID=A0A6A6FVK4_9PEZI|nr:hypothetical protein CERZMDRAFT_80217 [Cercospora zeae-maydis SCOH1-5]
MSTPSPIWTKAPLASAAHDFSSLPIAVHVGQRPYTTFYVNESTIRASSRFFEKALDKERKEGRAREVVLPAYDPGAFNIYLNWLTTGKLYIEDDTAVNKGESGIFYYLVHAFLLGDKLCAPDFKDAVTDAAAAVYTEGLWMPGKVLRRILYEHTVSGASLRRMVTSQLSMGKPLAVSEDEPYALLYELSHELAAGESKTIEDFKKDVEDCMYHEHQSGAEHCYRNKRR